jgi:hypothetical protein
MIEVYSADVTKVLCVAREPTSPQIAAIETPLAGESRLTLERQEPVGFAPRSTAGLRKPSAAGSGRRGVKPEKFERTKTAMRNDIEQGQLSTLDLSEMKEKNLASMYCVSRDTARKARNAVLSELNSRQISTNDK